MSDKIICACDPDVPPNDECLEQAEIGDIPKPPKPVRVLEKSLSNDDFWDDRMPSKRKRKRKEAKPIKVGPFKKRGDPVPSDLRLVKVLAVTRDFNVLPRLSEF